MHNVIVLQMEVQCTLFEVLNIATMINRSKFSYKKEHLSVIGNKFNNWQHPIGQGEL